MGSPVISIVIPAYNEAENIERTVNSLLNQSISKDLYEIVVVDNNSTDNTWEVISKLNVKAVKQHMQGCGPAKQKGLEEALGTYVLNADGDVFYPEEWIARMSKPLMEDDRIACVFSKHRFMPEPGYSKFKLYTLRKMRDVMVFLKSFKRPWLNCYGMSMGYRRDQALSVGFDLRNHRGDDGRMAYDLTKFGRIKMVNAPVYTHVRTLKMDGNMFQVIMKRVKREMPNLFENLSRQKEHDTKTSINAAGTLKNKAEK